MVARSSDAFESPLAIAARSFEETLEGFHLPEDAPELRNPLELGRRAALLAIAESAWGHVLGPLFDTDHARTILGVGSRQAVHDLMKRRRLLALDASNGRKLFPAFQFDRSGRPYSEVAEVIEIFSAVVETPYTIASWFVSPQDLLEGKTPAEWLRSGRDPAVLLKAARRAAGVLASH